MIEVNNLSYIVENKCILRSISSIFYKGKLSVLMGPSGAGKTTLMDLMAGRRNVGVICGNIFFDGQVYDNNNNNISSYIAYCQSYDIHIGELTIYQNLYYSCQLRSEKLLNDNEISEKCYEVGNIVGLTSAFHTIVGTVFLKGISGGQQKLLSIATELLGNPDVLFLDEPTTGLDALTSLSITKILNNLATNYQKTIICTIHQPSLEMIELYHHLCLLCQGSVVYNGDVNQLSRYLESIQLISSPSNIENPIEYCLELLGQSTNQEYLINSWKHQIKTGWTTTLPQNNNNNNNNNKRTRQSLPIYYQYWICVQRHFLYKLISPQGLLFILLTNVLSGIFYGILYYKNGTTLQESNFLLEPYDNTINFNEYAYNMVSLQFSTLLYVMLAQSLLISSSFHLKLFYQRELASSYLNPITKYLLLITIDLPMMLLSLYLYVLFVINFINPYGSEWTYYGLLLLTGTIGFTLAQLMIEVSSNSLTSFFLFSFISGLEIVFSGYFKSKDELPLELRWIVKFSCIYHGMGSMMYNEFHGNMGRQGDIVLYLYGYDDFKLTETYKILFYYLIALEFCILFIIYLKLYFTSIETKSSEDFEMLLSELCDITKDIRNNRDSFDGQSMISSIYKEDDESRMTNIEITTTKSESSHQKNTTEILKRSLIGESLLQVPLVDNINNNISEIENHIEECYTINNSNGNNNLMKQTTNNPILTTSETILETTTTTHNNQNQNYSINHSINHSNVTNRKSALSFSSRISFTNQLSMSSNRMLTSFNQILSPNIERMSDTLNSPRFSRLVHDTYSEKSIYTNINIQDNLNSEFNILESKKVTLQFENLSYTIKSQQSKNITLLNNINGIIKSGELCAIMGPTGSGKTTLLNVLAGRATLGQVNGLITVNNKIFPGIQKANSNPDINSPRFGYVLQDDAHYPVLTVKETLQFAAMLRMKITNIEDVDNIVENTMKLLGIDIIADNIIGNEDNRTISRGQLRRLTIGCEIINSSSLIFLDEPTSGLDSYLASTIVDTLLTLSKTGRTLLCTIHQPSTALFEKFNTLLFLVKGHLIYSGSIINCKSYFEDLEFSKMNTKNPAEYLFTILSDLPLQGNSKDNNKHSIKYLSEIIQQQYQNQYNSIIINNNNKLSNNNNNNDNNSNNIINSIYKQYSIFHSSLPSCSIIFQRNLKIEYRYRYNWLYNYIRSSISGILIGLIWYNISCDGFALLERLGLFLVVYLITSLWITEIISEESNNKQIFYNEKNSHLYTIFNYWINNQLIKYPLYYINTLLFTLPIYYFADLNDNDTFLVNYLIFFHIVYLSFIVNLLFNIVLIYSITNIYIHILIYPSFILTVQLLLSGYAILPSTLKSFIQWLIYINPCFIAMNGMFINEFKGNKCADSFQNDYDYYKEAYSYTISSDNIWLYLCLMIFVCKILGYIVMKYGNQLKV